MLVESCWACFFDCRSRWVDESLTCLVSYTCDAMTGSWTSDSFERTMDSVGWTKCKAKPGLTAGVSTLYPATDVVNESL